MRKAFNRFCFKYERFGIHDLMFYVAGSYVLVYIAELIQNGVIGYLTFDLPNVLHGQVWRIFTFVLVPPRTSIFFFIFAVLFAVFVGRGIEQAWGKMKTTVYFFTGALLSMIVACIFGISGMDGTYLSFSMLLAFATLNPDTPINLYLVIPIKVKYVAFFALILYIYPIVTSPFPMLLVPIVAIGNYLLFFAGDLLAMLRRQSWKRTKRRVQFHGAVHRATSAQKYRHKCAACGVTDIDDPDMEFRYCSLCAGTPCYCTKHLFNHEHR